MSKSKRDKENYIKKSKSDKLEKEATKLIKKRDKVDKLKKYKISINNFDKFFETE